VLAGVKLDIAWEVSSIPSIIDLVCAGYGCGVLTASAVAASARAGELRVRPLSQPQLISVLCVAVSAHKRSTPLIRQAQAMLQTLARALPQGAAQR
jgi:LysR family nitrogen assimilation transcriptional regulator